jgi:hypothetical protein
MTPGYKEAKALLNVDLLASPHANIPINSVLCSLSKALLLLTESLEADLAEKKKTTALLPPQE